MADDYDNELRGVLFKVREDKRTESGPVMRGECTVKGQKYRISAWSNTSQKGNKYWSLKLQKDDGEYAKNNSKPTNQQKQDSQAPLQGEDEDGIPF